MIYMYKELVREAKKGEGAAVETLLNKLNPLIYSAIRKQGRGLDPGDLYQEACIIFLEAVRDFDENRGVPFLAFIKSRIYFGIHNLARKSRNTLSLDRSLWEEDGLSALEMLEDSETRIEDLIIGKEIYEKLKEGIDILTPKQKGVIMGHFFQNKKLMDIARDKGVHYKGVLKLKDRALKRLRRYLEDFE
ncbi:MAG: sigma-70 family RNA polymerase sigma factor [Clostridiales bacterium]|nr:sigma-70 family RNA polymerase sigma factor [Clostridiales bacterium]